MMLKLIYHQCPQFDSCLWFLINQENDIVTLLKFEIQLACMIKLETNIYPKHFTPTSLSKYLRNHKLTKIPLNNRLSKYPQNYTLPKYPQHLKLLKYP